MNHVKIIVVSVMCMLALGPIVGHADNQPKASKQPFQQTFSYKDWSDFTETFQVPASKRLVIEYISASVTTTSAGHAVACDTPLDELYLKFRPRLTAQLQTQVGAQTAPHYWTHAYDGNYWWLNPGPGGATDCLGYVAHWHSAAQQTRIYADPGTTAEVRVELYDGCTNGHCTELEVQVTLSGYLVNPNVDP